MRQGINKDNIKYFYIISMTIAFIPRYGDVYVNRHIQLCIGAFWILYVFLEIAINKFRFNVKYNKDVLWMMSSYLVPPLILHAWTIMLMMLGMLSWEYFTTNFGTYIPIMLAISSIYIWGRNAFRVNFYALVLAYIISVTSSIILVSPKIVVDALALAFLGRGVYGYSSAYLELHDIVLPIGFVLTYYIFSNDKLSRKNVVIIICTIFIMILGLKRISVFGVFLAVIFHKIIKRFPKRTQYKICRIAGIVGVGACFLFVWSLIAGDFFWTFIEPLNINFMGRIYYWRALAERCVFSPAFLGLGRNYSYLLFSSELRYMKVGAAHSDILKMYAENGFFMFAYWLWHYLLHMTKRYKKRFSINSSVIYFGISIYLFTMYLTDNVETYFASILFSIIIPVSHALRYDRK